MNAAGFSPKRRLVFVSAARQSWGAEQSMYAIAVQAQQDGIEVALICFDGTIERDWEHATGVPALTTGSPAPLRERKISENLALFGAYLRIGRPFDRVALFTYYLAISALPLNMLLTGRRVRLSLDLHDNLPGEKGRALLRWTSKPIHQVICCSRFTAAQLETAAGVLPQGVAALHGPAEAMEVLTSDSGDVLRVCIAGRIIAEKGHHLVARAVSLLRPDAMMILRGAGDGSVHDNSEEVREFCTELLGDSFTDEGRVDPQRVLDNIDVMVVANPREPMGRTVLEAQLSGVLAVVPDAGGSSELVRDGVTGFVFRSGEPTDLARVLRKISRDPVACDRIRDRAREHAAGNVTSAAYGREYLRLLAG